MKHFILNCSAANSIEASGLGSLKAINIRLREDGIVFHLYEVKGPIMDGLEKLFFIKNLKIGSILHIMMHSKTLTYYGYKSKGSALEFCGYYLLWVESRLDLISNVNINTHLG